MRSKSETDDSLGNVVKDIGIMNDINCDKVLEQVGMNTDSMIKSRKYNIHVSSTES